MRKQPTQKAPFNDDSGMLTVAHSRERNHQKGAKAKCQENRPRKVIRQGNVHLCSTGKSVPNRLVFCAEKRFL